MTDHIHVELPSGAIANVTTDKHDTKGQAEGVCRILRREGLGGERCHFPIKTWVEPIYAETSGGLDDHECYDGSPPDAQSEAHSRCGVCQSDLEDDGEVIFCPECFEIFDDSTGMQRSDLRND